MAGDPNGPILAGCYYPDCDEEHHPKSKFCPAHGGPPFTSSPPANWAARATLNADGETFTIERRTQ